MDTDYCSKWRSVRHFKNTQLIGGKTLRNLFHHLDTRYSTHAIPSKIGFCGLNNGIWPLTLHWWYSWDWYTSMRLEVRVSIITIYTTWPPLPLDSKKSILGRGCNGPNSKLLWCPPCCERNVRLRSDTVRLSQNASLEKKNKGGRVVSPRKRPADP